MSKPNVTIYVHVTMLNSNLMNTHAGPKGKNGQLGYLKVRKFWQLTTTLEAYRNKIEEKIKKEREIL